MFIFSPVIASTLLFAVCITLESASFNQQLKIQCHRVTVKVGLCGLLKDFLVLHKQRIVGTH